MLGEVRGVISREGGKVFTRSNYGGGKWKRTEREPKKTLFITLRSNGREKRGGEKNFNI